MIITPMPVINPETSGYGMYLIYFPIFSRPNRICKPPASKNAAIIIHIPACKLPDISIAAATTIAETTVTGPVGPLICVAVPPKIAAKTPSIIAP